MSVQRKRGNPRCRFRWATFDVIRARNRAWVGVLQYDVNLSGNVLTRTVHKTNAGVEQRANGILADGKLAMRWPVTTGFELRRSFACRGSVAAGAAVELPAAGAVKLFSAGSFNTGLVYVKTGFNLKKSKQRRL